MFIRTLTPQTPRIIHVPDNQIGLARYGTYVEDPAPEQEHQIGPAASQAMANRAAPAGDLELPGQAKVSGWAKYDRAIDAWVKPPKPPIDVDEKIPAPSPPVWGGSSGPWFWVMCRETGVRMVRFRAQTAAQAQTIAGIYATAHKLPASAAYALKED